MNPTRPPKRVPLTTTPTDHAKRTVATLEKALRRRKRSNGLREYEKELLVSAYIALDVPMEDRLAGWVGGRYVTK